MPWLYDFVSLDQMTLKFCLHRCLLTVSLLCGFAALSYAQPDFYQITGPSQLQCGEPFDFFIETNTVLVSSDFTVTPPDDVEVYDHGLYGANILFNVAGTYLVVATSQAVNGQVFSDSLLVYVFGPNNLPEMIGCFINNTSNQCIQVCAGSHTILLDSTVSEWEVSGPATFEYVGQSGIDITWGEGGFSKVVIYDQPCYRRLCFEIVPAPVPEFSTIPVAIQDTVTVCKFEEVVFQNQSFNGLIYEWNFGDGSVSNSFNESHAFTDEGFYTVTLDAGTICSCVAQKQVVVHVLPAAVPTLDCVNSVCPESRQHYSATTDGCDVFSWSISTNGTVVNGGGNADDFIEIIWHDGPYGIINLSVDNCNSAYCSNTNTFTIPIITPDGPIEGDASVCSGEKATYSAPYFPGTQYHWEMGTNGHFVSDDGGHEITVQWDEVNSPAASFVKVTYNNCFLECGGEASLNVNITPEIRIQGDQQLCQNATGSVSAIQGFEIFQPVNVEWHIEDAAGNIVYTQPGSSDLFTYAFSGPPGFYFWVAENHDPAYCTESVKLQLEVTASPIPPVAIHGDTVICPGLTYGYTIDPAASYATHWVFTDGLNITNGSGQASSHLFGNTPPYTISAYFTDLQFPGCVSDTISISLHTLDDYSISGPRDACLNGIYTYSYPLSSGVDYQWEIIPATAGEIKKSNLNEVEIFWTQTGPATVRLNACGAMIDNPVVVHSLPVFNLAGPPAACANELVSYTTDQPGAMHTWYDQDGNVFSHLNNVSIGPGTYGVEISDMLGCINENSFSITTYPAPTVNLTTNDKLYYCNTVTGGVRLVANTDGANYTFEWFKDDVSQGVGTAIFVATDFGYYHVAVTNQYGCTTLSAKIRIENCCVNCSLPPGGPPGCTYIPFDYNILRTNTECNVHAFDPQVPGIEPNSSRWVVVSASEGVITFEDVDHFEYTYAKPGYYQLVLLNKLTGFPYAGDCGHGQVFADTVRAVADFKYTGVCAGSLITFEDLTTFLPGETISFFQWDFDDPASGGANTAFIQHPTHIFANAGDYEVQVKVTMVSGCFTTKKITVHISGGPLLTPIFDAIYCEKEAQRFDLPGQVFDVMWNFGDPASGVQNTSTAETGLHTYDVPDLYIVTVEANDIYGCHAQVITQTDIRPNTLSGVINQVPMGLICFGDTSILTAPPGGVDWNWSNTQTDAQIKVTEGNTYSVLMHDLFGCSYTPPAVVVNVLPKPEIVVKGREIIGGGEYGPWQSPLQICEGTEFQLQAFGSGNLAYHWTFGEDGQIISFTNEGGNLPGIGTYEFHVYGNDPPSFCYSDTTSITVEIYAAPIDPVIALTGGSGCSFDDNILTVTNPESAIEYLWSDGQKEIR